MFDITLITMGKLKEKFYISAAQEYAKRLSGYCHFTLVELPESRLPENPSPAEIAAGLEKEAEIKRLTAEMKQAAKILEFEHAAYLRDKINKLREGT